MHHVRALTAPNLDYLTAQLHGRRSRMAEGDCLDALCRVRSLSELTRHVWPDEAAQTVSDFQRRVVEDLTREMSELVPLLPEPGAGLIEWMLVRRRVSAATVCKSWEACAASVPAGPLRASVEDARNNPARPFYMEAALDRGYYQELLARAAALPREERAVVKSLFCHAAATFRHQLLTRGTANFGLKPEELTPFVELTPCVEARSGQVSAVHDEAFAANQLYRLANRAMRRDPTGLGTVIGYVTLREIEVANLITISEGLRLGLAAEIIRVRMIPGSMVHV